MRQTEGKREREKKGKNEWIEEKGNKEKKIHSVLLSAYLEVFRNIIHYFNHHFTRPKGSSLKFRVWAVWYASLGQFFIKDVKITLEHCLDGPCRTNLENRENARIPANRVSSLTDIQNGKTQPFFNISVWNLVHIFSSHFAYYSVLSQLFRFWKFNENFEYLRKTKFFDNHLYIHNCHENLNSKEHFAAPKRA